MVGKMISLMEVPVVRERFLSASMAAAVMRWA